MILVSVSTNVEAKLVPIFYNCVVSLKKRKHYKKLNCNKLSSYVDNRPQPYYIMLTISNEDEDTIENSEIPGSVAIKEYISNNASNVAPNWENSGSESKNAKKRRLKLERQEANKERKRNERKRKKIEDQEKRRKLRELKGPKPLDSIQYDDETRQRMKAERLAKDAEERQKYLKEFCYYHILSTCKVWC